MRRDRVLLGRSRSTENRLTTPFPAPDVTTVHKEIAKVVPEGIIDEAGTLHEVDVLVCATGFNLAFAPPL